MSVIKRQTILGTIYSYLGVAVGTLTMALIVPNYFSTEEYGLIGLLSKDMLVLVIIISLGFNYSGNRFFNFFRSAEERHKGYVFWGLVTLLVGTVLVALILFFFRDFLQKSAAEDNALYVKYYYFLLPLTISTGLFNLFDNYAKSLYDTVTGTFLSQLLIRVLVLCSVLVHVFGWIDFHGFILWWVVSMSVPSIFMMIHCVRLGNFSLAPHPYFREAPFKVEFLRFAGYSSITALSASIIMILDSRMVYSFLGLSMSGIYSFCLLFGSIMTMSYNANVKAATPIVLDAIQKGETARIGQIFTKSGITQLMFGTIILILVWVSVDSIFSLVKPEYLLGKYALIIIGISKLYDLGSGINAIILSYSKYYKYDSVLVISFIGLLVVLNYFMIPRHGLNGAAVAALVATVYYNSARNLLIWKFFKIHPYSKNQLKVIIIGMVILGLGLMLPDITGGFWFSVVSILYKSALLVVAFLFVFYKLKISDEVSDVMDKAIAVIKARF